MIHRKHALLLSIGLVIALFIAACGSNIGSGNGGRYGAGASTERTRRLPPQWLTIPQPLLQPVTLAATVTVTAHQALRLPRAAAPVL